MRQLLGDVILQIPGRGFAPVYHWGLYTQTHP